MSEIEIPIEAIEIAKDHIRNDADDDQDARGVAEVVLADAAPRVVAAELRRLATGLEPEQDRMREKDGRGIRSSALGVAIVRLRERANELDPQGGQS